MTTLDIVLALLAFFAIAALCYFVGYLLYAVYKWVTTR